MNHYRFRAECEADFLRLQRHLEKAAYQIHPNRVGLPDVEVDILTLLDIEIIRQLMLAIPDGHVMAETLANAAEFTGDRTFATMTPSLFN